MNGFARLPVAFQQFANQLVFLAVGKFAFKLSVTWLEIALILGVSAAVEHALLWLRDRRLTGFSKPALSTGFNIAFMLGATHFKVYAVAIVAGLAQKHLSKRFLGAHFQNPSNFGIVAALLLFPEFTFVTYLDWGQTLWFAGLIVALGLLLLQRLRLAYLPAVFLATYAALQLLLVSHGVQAIFWSMSSAGFLLFAFFMLTDPKAIPATRAFAALHGMVTALLATALPLFLGEKDVNLFLSLVLASALVPCWRYFERQPRVAPWRVLAAGWAGIVIFAVALFVSPLNVPRNARLAFRQAAALPPLTPAEFHAPAPLTHSTEIWESIDHDAYRASWSEPEIVIRSLRDAPAPKPYFTHVPGALPRYFPALEAADLGDETRLYAGVAAGDLNLDGYIDLILHRIREPIRVLINNRRGGFVEIAPFVFEGPVPESIESLALADMNGDRFLDLIAVPSAYFTAEPGQIYVFNPALHKYQRSPVTFGQGRHSSGGISVYDVNGDGVLDFYVSFGVNWRSAALDKVLDTDPDLFMLSGGGEWRDSIGRFGDELTKNRFAGMTALFTDVDRDGAVDFLLGNDFADPSLFFRGDGERFSLVPARRIENNTRNSMSYFAADFDNDGKFEIWENGFAPKQAVGRLAYAKDYGQTGRSVLNQELAALEKQRQLANFQCEGMTHPYTRSLCKDQAATMLAATRTDAAYCTLVVSFSMRQECEKLIRGAIDGAKLPSPNRFKYDVERYPKQLLENVLLRYDTRASRWRQAIKNNTDALYTGFTWGAYPFDIDNDGYLDLYITNGLQISSHDSNRLLLNRSSKQTIRFEEQAHEMGVALEDDSRGALIADFDHDGDGDLVVNTHLTEARFFQNQHGGQALTVELRMPGKNYYAVGAQLDLVTTRGNQTRALSLGGHWNTSQPLRAHFGLAAGTRIGRLDVRWPDGERTSYPGVAAGNRYIIYR